jgi:hypothetical protein
MLPAYVLTVPLQISMRLMPPSSEQYSHSHALSIACGQHASSGRWHIMATTRHYMLLQECMYVRTASAKALGCFACGLKRGQQHGRNIVAPMLLIRVPEGLLA